LKEEVYYQSEREAHLQTEYSQLMAARNSLLERIQGHESTASATDP